MAFGNISAFKGQFKDSLPATHYEVAVNPPGGGAEEIVIRTENINMPGISYMSVDNYSPAGNGLTYNFPYRYNPQEISMTHTIDENGRIYKIFHTWAKKIVDLVGEAQYGAYYHKDYAKDMFIFVYNRKLELTNQILLEEVFPISVDPVSLSWGDHDNIAKLNVNYRFTKFKVLK